MILQLMHINRYFTKLFKTADINIVKMLYVDKASRFVYRVTFYRSVLITS